MTSSDSNKTKKYGGDINNSNGTSHSETSISSISNHSGGYQPLQSGDIRINIDNQPIIIGPDNPFHDSILAAINVGKNIGQIPGTTSIVPPPLNRNLTSGNLNSIYTNLNGIIGNVGAIYNNLNPNNPNPNNPNNPNPSNSSNSNSSNPNPNPNSSEK